MKILIRATGFRIQFIAGLGTVMVEPFHPLICDHLDVGMTHQRLQEHVNTMFLVAEPNLIGLERPVIVLPVHGFAQPVQTVDLVEYVPLDDIFAGLTVE